MSAQHQMQELGMFSQDKRKPMGDSHYLHVREEIRVFLVAPGGGRTQTRGLETLMG